MKKHLLFLALTLCIGSTKAQFVINENSHAALKTSVSNDYVFRINGTSGVCGGLQVTRLSDLYNPNGTPYASAIYGHINHQSAAFSNGIRGYATNTSSINMGRTFGVFGTACGATEGYNYGVFGIVSGTSKGAGVYGTMYDGDYGTALTQRYAGYFRGPVGIQGNLTVTGNISGTLLCAPSSSSSSALSLSESQSLGGTRTTTNLLGALDVSTFYHEQPTSSVRNNTTSADTAEMVIPLTVIEQQVLSKQHYGLNADQLEEVFPDLVYENEEGTKSINYVEMVPILVQAINELSAKVNALEGGNGSARKLATNSDGIGKNVQILSLGQNRPNPFGTSTEIEVTVPETVQNAFVYVYDLQGKKVQQVDIIGRGKQIVYLNATNLTDGMYLYSLIADGKVVETRRMIVEK